MADTDTRDTDLTAPREALSPAKVLCVDDDSSVLDGLRRLLACEFDVVSESSPIAALSRLERELGFEVIISDLKMPLLSGTQFLAEAKRLMPGATRLLLTGVADLPSVVAAVNEAAVFRLLIKPCGGPQLLDAVQHAVFHHRSMSGGEPEPDAPRAPGTITWLQRPPARWRADTGVSRAVGAFPSAPGQHTLEREQTAADATAPSVSQTRRCCNRVGSHLAALAGKAQVALDHGRARDAERILEAPLRNSLMDARAGKPLSSEDAELIAVLAARLAVAGRNGAWLDYPFLLFAALRRLLPSAAIDEIQVALQQVRGANPAALHLYLNVLDYQARDRSSPERYLLKRIQQCRALVQVGT